MMPQLRPVADRALLVDFADHPGPGVEAAVQALDRALAAHPCPGFAEAVPGFVNLLVVFDPLRASHGEVAAHLTGLLSRKVPAPAPGRLHDIPVCYDPPFAPDLDDVAARTGLGREGVIAAHLAGELHVVMFGFAPGYAYLGGLDPSLVMDRKPAAVRGVPKGSVIIAGRQCLITTLQAPTGWWRIGHTPAQVLTGDDAAPFLFAVGDRLRFRRIRADELPSHG